MANVSTLVGNIKKLLDMNNSSAALITASDIDALSLDEVIQGTLVNAARYIELNAPVHLVDGISFSCTYPTESIATQSDEQVASGNVADQITPGTTVMNNTTVTNIGNGYYKVTVSLDGVKFLRLLSMKLSDWSRPGKVITEEDPRYALQSSPWGVKGTPDDPIVAIVNGGSKTILEAYSGSSSDVTVAKLLYVPIRAISGTSITISEKLQSAIEYYGAYLTCLTYGNANLANYMLQQALTLAQIPTSVPQSNKE